MDTHIKKKMLHVKHLQKSFKDKTVLKEVTFDVTPGEVFVLLGSNGAGKTKSKFCPLSYLLTKEPR
nr:ATP-binding cassette domain-containing protein [Enterococcus casseliflavus]